MGLERIHEFKVNKYDKPDIHRWMKQNNPIADAGRQKGLITALILNWMGSVSWQSWNCWKAHEVTRRMWMWMLSVAGDLQDLEVLQAQHLVKTRTKRPKIDDGQPMILILQ